MLLRRPISLESLYARPVLLTPAPFTLRSVCALPHSQGWVRSQGRPRCGSQEGRGGGGGAQGCQEGTRNPGHKGAVCGLEAKGVGGKGGALGGRRDIGCHIEPSCTASIMPHMPSPPHARLYMPAVR